MSFDEILYLTEVHVLLLFFFLKAKMGVKSVTLESMTVGATSRIALTTDALPPVAAKCSAVRPLPSRMLG